jgi:hypothetical protein
MSDTPQRPTPSAEDADIDELPSEFTPAKKEGGRSLQEEIDELATLDDAADEGGGPGKD